MRLWPFLEMASSVFANFAISGHKILNGPFSGPGGLHFSACKLWSLVTLEKENVFNFLENI